MVRPDSRCCGTPANCYLATGDGAQLRTGRIMDTVTRTTGEIAAAKLRLAAAEVGIGHGEPLQPLIDAMAETVAALHDARQPIPEVALHNAIVQGIGVYAQDMIVR